MEDELSARRLKLQNYTNKDLIEGLSWVYDQALNGNITGACFIIKHDRFKHSVGVLGKYRDDPYCAIQAHKKLKRVIKKYAKEKEDHAELQPQY